MKKILIVITVLSIMTIGYAQNDDLSGFRGIKWGMQFKDIPDKQLYKLIQTTKDNKIYAYAKTGDIMDLEGVRLHRIRYLFLNNQFAMAILINDGMFTNDSDYYYMHAMRDCNSTFSFLTRNFGATSQRKSGETLKYYKKTKSAEIFMEGCDFMNGGYSVYFMSNNASFDDIIASFRIGQGGL